MKKLLKLINKAKQSKCRFKVAAIGFSKKGNVLGCCYNTSRFNYKGGGLHAEHRLIRRYGSKITTIIIARVGNSGRLLPIDPCPSCAKIAAKNNIKIISI